MEQGREETAQTPAEQWNAQADKRALDELFASIGRYSSGTEFAQLLNFTRRFKHYSPFNALLMHMQIPGGHLRATGV